MKKLLLLGASLQVIATLASPLVIPAKPLAKPAMGQVPSLNNRPQFSERGLDIYGQSRIVTLLQTEAQQEQIQFVKRRRNYRREIRSTRF